MLSMHEAIASDFVYVSGEKMKPKKKDKWSKFELKMILLMSIGAVLIAIARFMAITGCVR